MKYIALLAVMLPMLQASASDTVPGEILIVSEEGKQRHRIAHAIRESAEVERHSHAMITAALEALRARWPEVEAQAEATMTDELERLYAAGSPFLHRGPDGKIRPGPDPEAEQAAE